MIDQQDKKKKNHGKITYLIIKKLCIITWLMNNS